MITQIISCCLWAGTQLNTPQPIFSPLATSKPSSHLRPFFDARNLGSGEAIYAWTPGIAPTFLPLPYPKALLHPKAKSLAKVEAAGPAKKGNGKISSHIQPALPKVAAANTNLEDIRVSLNCVQFSLHQIINLLAAQTNANLTLLANDGEKLTMRFKDRRLVDAIRDICAMSDLSYLKIDNAFIIAKEDKLKTSYAAEYVIAHTKPVQEDTVVITRTYKTNFLDGNRLVESIAKAFKDDQQLTMIAAPSQPNPSLATQDTGQQSGVAASVIGKDDVLDKASRTIVLRGPRAVVESAIAMMTSLDVCPTQVHIAVTIDDVSGDFDRELGLEWTLPSATFTEKGGNGINVGHITRSPLSFTAALKALETENKAKILANPSISVLDGQRAYILVGQRLTFPVVVEIGQNGQPVFSKQEERVGIYLQVSVWVTNDGQVKLQLYPQVSTVTGFINVNGGQYPQISTREAQTTLTIASGKTIVLGGLIDNQETVNIQRVPILGQIPILKELFTRRQHTKSKSQVIITITPTIIPGNNG